MISAGANLPATASYPSAGLPESASVFSAAAVIHSVKVSTKKVGTYLQGFFSDSVIAAYTVGAIQLSQLNATGGGIASHSYGSFTAVSPSGNLDRINIRLSHGQLSTITKLQSALTHLGVAFAAGPVPTVDRVLYDFEIEVLG